MVDQALVAVGLTAGLAGTAGATTTVGPAEPGTPPLVRASTVDISLDLGAQSFYRSSALGAYAPATAFAIAFLGQGCRGDNPGGTNASPRDQVTVSGPGGTVLDRTSPVRDLTTAGFLTSPPNQALTPQPEPTNTNYRGDFPASATSAHGWSLKLDLTGKPGGLYTVTTTTTNMARTGFFGACSVATPADDGRTLVPGPVVTTQTFEYRPWQASFVDVFRGGRVDANLTPREFAWQIGTASAPVTSGATTQTFYRLPGGAQFLLPTDPAGCASTPTSCLPSGATSCDPTAGCSARLMVINKPTGADGLALQGIFDLQTKAFIALARVGGTQRLLMSLGTANDNAYGAFLAKLNANAAKRGVDLARLLATEVNVDTAQGGLSLSLLNGLQINPASSPTGVHLTADATVQAGVILDIYSTLRLTGPPCVANTGSSAQAPSRYRAKEPTGYVVKRSDLVSSVPKVGALGAIAGGPVYNITGKFNGPTAPLVNAATAVIGVDTAGDEPNGYPVWVSPFVSGTHVAAPRTMDFLGTATWSASETPLSATFGCLTVDFMLGTGVAVYNNPLPVGFNTLLNPASIPNGPARRLMGAVDQSVQDVVDQVTGNEVVDQLLTSVIGQLPLSMLP